MSVDFATVVEVEHMIREPTVLWVHPGNRRARRFYASRGWVNDEVERQQSVLGVDVPELRYSIHLIRG